MRALPEDYEALSTCFPAMTVRAQALGVSRELVRRWETQLPRRPLVRDGTAQSIERVAAIAREAQRRVSSPEAAGRWMLSEQPALAGRRVVDLARAGDFSVIGRLFTPPSSDAPRRSFSAEEVRAASRGILADTRTPRERPRDPDAARVLRLIGADDDLIGPAP
jgi:hypothetical protein